MKVVVFAGGSGSAQLHKGLVEFFKLEDINVIINAYDNGLSTGVCRKVLDGKMLGPSDLRKVQLLHAQLYKTCSSNLLTFLNKRAYADNAQEMFNNMNDDLRIVYNSDSSIKEPVFNLINRSINSFFKLDTVKNLKFNDFSYSNIIYTGCAALFGNSLQSAGREIATTILNIPIDSVELISDDSLYLQAVTESGHTILDEGDIVDWNNPNDKIVSIKLVDTIGNSVIPQITDKAKELINSADLIIFSSGTQWSSLIPTYIHEGFYSLIKESKADKYLVMNLTQDKDMKGVNSNEILAILSEFLPLVDIKKVFSTNAVEEMQFKNTSKHVTHCIEYLSAALTHNAKNIHNGYELITAILGYKYQNLTNSSEYLFDFDDTLVARSGNIDASFNNFEAFLSTPNYTIVTGNSKKHIEEKIKWIHVHNNIVATENNFYCDGGNALYKWSKNENRLVLKKYVDTKFVLTNSDTQKIYDALQSLSIPTWKIENRANCIISIKPIEYREEVALKMKQLLEPHFQVNCTGNTTIDIMLAGYDKSVVLKDIIKNDDASSITYFGDELKSGNDSCMMNQPGVSCVEINNVVEMSFYLKLLSTWKQTVKH